MKGGGGSKRSRERADDAEGVAADESGTTGAREIQRRDAGALGRWDG